MIKTFSAFLISSVLCVGLTANAMDPPPAKKKRLMVPPPADTHIAPAANRSTTQVNPNQRQCQQAGIFKIGNQTIVKIIQPEFLKIMKKEGSTFNPAWLFPYCQSLISEGSSSHLLLDTRYTQPHACVNALITRLKDQEQAGNEKLQLERLIRFTHAAAEKHQQEDLKYALNSLINQNKEDLTSVSEVTDAPIAISSILAQCEMLADTIHNQQKDTVYKTLMDTTFNTGTHDCVFSLHLILENFCHDSGHTFDSEELSKIITKYARNRHTLTVGALFNDAEDLQLSRGKVLIALCAMRCMSEIIESNKEDNPKFTGAPELNVIDSVKHTLHHVWEQAKYLHVASEKNGTQDLIATLSLQLSESNFLTGESLYQQVKTPHPGRAPEAAPPPASPNYPSEQKELDIDDLCDVFTAIEPVRAKWDSIGLVLGISNGNLQAIKKDKGCVDTCCQEMISQWLKGNVTEKAQQRPRTWNTLCDALKRRSEAALAKKIQKEHSSQPEPTLKDVCTLCAPITHKLQQLAVGLGIPNDKIHQIEKGEYPLADAIDYWLRGNISNVPITYQYLCDTLASAAVGEWGLAQTIQKKHSIN